MESLCGFPPQSVPPLGHVAPSSPLRILVDESLYRPAEEDSSAKTKILYGGGGHPRIGCLIDADILLKVEGTELVNVTKLSDSTSSHTDSDDSTTSSSSTSRHMSPSAIPTRTKRIKPFFPLPPPSMEQVHAILSHPDQPNPLQPIPFTFVGRVNGIRRMARRLVFCDIAPIDYVGTGTKVDAQDLPWTSGRDGAAMAAQLIAGKTFCRARGDGPGAAALRALRVGQVLCVEGKTNVGNRESLQHWRDKRSLDVVVFDFRILEEPPESSSSSSSSIRQRGKQASREKDTPKASSAPLVVKTPPDPETCLKLTDVFTKVNGDSMMIELVDDEPSIQRFSKSLDQLLDLHATDSTHSSCPIFTGIDCEWKPKFLLASPGEIQPVLLLQISLQRLNKVYLVDLPTLLRPCLGRNEPLNPLEATTSHALSKWLSSQNFLKVGFQIATDLERLAGSYPHIPAFRTIQAVAEVGSMAKMAIQISSRSNAARQMTESLSKLTLHLLGKSIHKEQQISDWSLRPLTQEQLDYAALDAATPPELLSKAMDLVEATWGMDTSSVPTLGRYEGDTAFARAITSTRFSFLEVPSPGLVRRLKAKKLVSQEWIVGQSWVTGQMAPALPTLSDVTDGEPYVDLHGTLRVPTMKLRVEDDDHLKRITGLSTGRSKDQCLRSLFSDEDSPLFPKGCVLEYYPRSGYVELENAMALFVNSPLRPGETPSSQRRRGGGARYCNRWLQEGRFLTWFLRRQDWQDGTSRLAHKLVGSSGGVGDGDEENPSATTVVLFIRDGTHDFICCGPCRVMIVDDDSSEPDEGGGEGGRSMLEFQLELLYWEKLHQDLPYFREMALEPSW